MLGSCTNSNQEFFDTGNANGPGIWTYLSDGVAVQYADQGALQDHHLQYLGPMPDVPQNHESLAERSAAFGLASDERFSIEGYFTLIAANGSTTVNLGGLEGKKAYQEGEEGTNATVSRSVFSYIQVADKFIEDYYFEFQVEGVMVKINFYYIIG